MKLWLKVVGAVLAFTTWLSTAGLFVAAAWHADGNDYNDKLVITAFIVLIWGGLAAVIALSESSED